MIFIICIVVGIIGIVGILWISSASIRYLENPIAHGTEWFQFHPEYFQSGITSYFQKHARYFLKKILIWLIAVYRKLAQKITVKQMVKKKIREFLYDHSTEGKKHPSEFWNKVRHNNIPQIKTDLPPLEKE